MTAPASIFASCAPGLEALLAAELAAVGALDPRVVPGGVELRGHRRVIYRANLECGLATHVLVRLATFVARDFPALEQGLGEVAWERWLQPGVPRAVRATASKSRLHHTGALAERCERAIGARLGEAPDGADAVPIVIRMERDVATISLDTSGAPLHRRGYRLHTTAAPLREDLARALVIASGWDRASPLVDPMCGSGTIAIEAALLARGAPPGRGRRFAFERTALFDRGAWESVRDEAAERTLPRAPAPILASDRDAAAIDAARENATRASVDRDVTLEVRALSELTIPSSMRGGAGALIANPPYGRRLGDADRLAPLYRAIGRRAGELPGWRVAILTSERRLGMLVSSELRTAFVTKSGGLSVRALVRSPAASR